MSRPREPWRSIVPKGVGDRPRLGMPIRTMPIRTRAPGIATRHRGLVYSLHPASRGEWQGLVHSVHTTTRHGRCGRVFLRFIDDDRFGREKQARDRRGIL